MPAKLRAQIQEYEQHLESLRQELSQRVTRLNDLQGKRSEMEAQLQSLLSEITQLQTEVGDESAGTLPKKRGRKKGVKNGEGKKPGRKPKQTTAAQSAKKERKSARIPLHEYIIKGLHELPQPVTAQALADHVVAQGYNTKSKSLETIVANQLSGLKDIVQNVRGKGYTLIEKE